MERKAFGLAPHFFQEFPDIRKSKLLVVKEFAEIAVSADGTAERDMDV
jgi:hypothetical protein